MNEDDIKRSIRKYRIFGLTMAFVAAVLGGTIYLFNLSPQTFGPLAITVAVIVAAIAASKTL